MKSPRISDAGGAYRREIIPRFNNDCPNDYNSSGVQVFGVQVLGGAVGDEIAAFRAERSSDSHLGFGIACFLNT
jgi:hypothetical protein